MSLQEKFANPPKAARACGIKRLRAELALDPKTHNELIALNGMLESKDDWPDRALLAAYKKKVTANMCRSELLKDTEAWSAHVARRSF